eukprot:SAG31_NODE_67_length_28318_cov_6.493674_2_plen_52_part_00
MMLWAEGGGEAMTTMVGGESVDDVKTRHVDVSLRIYYIINRRLPDRDRTAL